MPYTPPAQQSPAASKQNSPSLSRSSSYSEDGPRSPLIGRPSPPRSMSSTSYLHKHRRSPSITKSDAAPPTPTEVPAVSFDVTDFAHHGSLRQSPPPINHNKVPTGAVLSPPDSSENSDGDDNGNVERGRELRKTWEELEEAVRGINVRRESSPDKIGMAWTTGAVSEPVSQAVSPTALTKEARKISHSRSSTEITILKPSFESPSGTSEDSEEDNGEFDRPSLVRKKSGELVKPALRPSSRRRYSSMPGTPTYAKSVHFNESDNQTRHFLAVDKPIAVSAGTSPVESYDSETEFPFGDSKAERDIRLANFPEATFDQRSKPIRVERIFLSEDKQTLIGICAVQNISFHKLVVARFTLDYWKTTSEVVATYNNDPRSPRVDGCDRFNFHIKLSDQANIDDKTLLLCVRYNVGTQEFWDNNNDTNYQIDFNNVIKKPTKPAAPSGLGARPLNAIPRSRHSPPTSSRGQRDSLDDDFAARSGSNSAYDFSSTDKLLGESPSSIKLKPRTKRGSIFPNGSQPATNGLGGRYDFSSSLSAALGNVSDKRQGPVRTIPKPSGGSYFGPMDRTEGPTKTTERPDAITTDRPAMGSEQYKDLVQKFCYFTPSAGKPAPAQVAPSQAAPVQTAPVQTAAAQAAPAKPDPSEPPAVADGAYDGGNSASPSPTDSGTSSPQHYGNTQIASPVRSPFASPRSASPAPATGGVLGARAASPISFGYPYYHHMRDGYLSDTLAPTAIHG